MVPQKVDLIVKKSGKVLAGPLSSRPVRRLPNGLAGAVYRGLVYPLYAGDEIDIDDAAVEKDLCDFVIPGETIPYASRTTSRGAALNIDRYVETNSYGHYLVFKGDETVCDSVLDALDRAGIEVRRYGRSFRAANNGVMYDWFVRLSFDGTREECLEAIESAFQAGQEPAAAPIDSDVLKHALAAVRTVFQPQIDSLTAERERLDRLLAEKQREVDDLRTKADELKKALLESRKDAKKVKASIAEEKQQRNAPPKMPSVESMAENVREAIMPLLKERDDARAAEERARRSEEQAYEELAKQEEQHRLQSQERDERLATVEKQYREAEEQLASMRKRALLGGALAGSGPAGRGRRRNDETLIQQLMQSSFPHLSLDEDAYGILAECFKDPGEVVDILRRLNEQDGSLPIFAVRGYDDLKEVRRHINTGDPSTADMGRVYLRDRPNGGFVVYLHVKKDKKEQERYLKRIAERSLDETMRFVQQAPAKGA